jgi:hypothetical protein
VCLLFVTVLHVLVKPDKSAFPATSFGQDSLHFSIAIFGHTSRKVGSKKPLSHTRHRQPFAALHHNHASNVHPW